MANAVQVLIRNQFPHIGGLQNTALFQLKRSTKPFQSGKGSLQIIHIDNNHWVVASTMNCRNTNITIYVSMNPSVSMQKTQKDQFTIQIAKVNSQELKIVVCLLQLTTLL